MSERLNIKHFTAEPEKEPPIRYFDPERDITEEQWEMMRRYRIKQAEEGFWNTVADVAANETILGRRPALTPEETEEIRKFKRAGITRDGDWPTFIQRAAKGAILGIPSDITSWEWMKVQSQLDVLAQAGSWEHFAEEAANETITGRQPNITAEQRENIRERRLKLADEGSWSEFSVLAAQEAILGCRPEITPEQWEKILEVHEKHKQSSAWHLSMVAYIEAILAADEVIIPPGGGLELTWNRAKDLEEDTPPTPQSRNF